MPDPRQLLDQLHHRQVARRTGRGTRARRPAAQEGQAHRPRAARPPARRGQLRRARPVRHPSLHRLRAGPAGLPGRRRGDRLGADRRAPGLRVLPGLHGLRRLPLGGARGEDLQGDGPGPPERRAGDRAQRFRRRPHPGRRRVARRLRRHLPPQHARVRVVPQISAILGPCAGGAVYSPAITDFIFMVAGELHVRHRPQRGEDGDARGGHLRRAGRRRRARRGCRASPTSSTTPSPNACWRCASWSGFSRSTISMTLRAAPPTIRSTGGTTALLDVVPDSANKPYDMHERHRPRGGRRRRSSRCTGPTPRTCSSASPGWAAPGRDRGQPAGGAGRRARHQRLGQGRAVHPVL